MKHVLLSALLLLVFASPALAGPDDPVRLSDVHEMINKKRQSVDQVIVAMSERGLGFRVTASAERKLKSWGFTEDDLGQVNRVAAGLPLEQKEPENEPDKQAEPAAGDLPNEFPIGYAFDDRTSNWQERVMSRAFEGARLDYKIYKFERFALYCSPRRAKDLSPLLRKLDKDLASKLPKSIGNAIEPKTSILILVDNRGHAYKLADAIRASYRVDNPDYLRGFRDAKNWSFWVNAHYTIVDGASFRDAKSALRPLSFGVGYMIASHIAHYKEPDALTLGMGNLIETLATGSPATTLFSESGEDENEIDNWKNNFKQRRDANRLPDIRQILDYKSIAMKHSHYVESWALATHLAAQPDKFFNVLYRCRDAKVPALDLILKEYAVDEKRLNQQWMQALGK